MIDKALPPHSPRAAGQRGLAWLAAWLAGAAAVAVGLVLAVIFAASVVVIGLMAGVLLTLAGWAVRARRALRPAADRTVLEARNVGGHSWVVYGWDRRDR